jgi:hypothetical protein
VPLVVYRSPSSSPDPTLSSHESKAPKHGHCRVKPRQLAPTVGTTESGSTGSPAPPSPSTTIRSHLVNSFLRRDQLRQERRPTGATSPTNLVEEVTYRSNHERRRSGRSDARLHALPIFDAWTRSYAVAVIRHAQATAPRSCLVISSSTRRSNSSLTNSTGGLRRHAQFVRSHLRAAHDLSRLRFAGCSTAPATRSLSASTSILSCGEIDVAQLRLYVNAALVLSQRDLQDRVSSVEFRRQPIPIWLSGLLIPICYDTNNASRT